MELREIMTPAVVTAAPDAPVQRVAVLMRERNVGSVVLVDGSGRPVGIVTDRDLAVRVLAQGSDPEQTQVGQVASTDVVALTPEHDLDDALKLMAREQVRRLPIVAGENQLVGMVAQADVARATKEKSAGEVIEAISEPPRGPRISGPEGGSDVRVADEDRDEERRRDY
jgi:CBS domain-containing protein